MFYGRDDTEVIKVEIPRWIAESFQKYVSEKYDFRKEREFET